MYSHLMNRPNVAVIGTPRSGSSFLSKLLVDNGWLIPFETGAPTMAAYSFNPDGYFESTLINLLNDQLIRASFGETFSFLNPPDVSKKSKGTNFSFDLDEDTVDIPKGFLENLEEYTSQNWDVWGISRMMPGGKWHKAYSRHKIDTSENIESTFDGVKQYLSKKSGYVVKDSRLSFTLNGFENSIDKVIILGRKKDGLVSSIQNHYGKRIFTDQVHAPFEWVSNHFNYKIPPMDFEDFQQRYRNAYSSISPSYEVFELDQSELNDEKKVAELSNFLGAKLNSD